MELESQSIVLTAGCSDCDVRYWLKYRGHPSELGYSETVSRTATAVDVHLRDTDHSEIGGSVWLEQLRGWLDRRRMLHLARRELFLYVVTVHVAARCVVDQGELEEGAEHEGQAHPRPNVDSFRVRDRWQ